MTRRDDPLGREQNEEEARDAARRASMDAARPGPLAHPERVFARMRRERKLAELEEAEREGEAIP